MKMSLFDGKTVLITGGTGSFGSAALKRMLSEGASEVRILSRDACKQAHLRDLYHGDSRLRFFAGSIPCVLPASCYYEWSKETHARYAFRTADECMYLGGLARQFADGWHFVILTEEAKGEARTIHDRQPLVFTYEDAKKWCASLHPTSLLENSIQYRSIVKA